MTEPLANANDVSDLFTQLWLTVSANLEKIIVALLMIAFFSVLAKLVLSQLTRYTSKLIAKAKLNPDEAKGRQVITAMTLLRSIGRYLIYFILLALILYQLGFGNVLSNLLVTAGFGSLAISFGAQSIVKDMVTGFFMMFEKQYAVGDFVKIGDYEGTVTSIAMRVTYLQNFKGQRIIIPNGSITNVINYSSEFSMAMVTIPTPYEADTLRLINLTEQVIKLYAQDNADVFLEQPQVQGISNLNTSSVDLLITAKVKPLTQWKTERELRLRIKECFDQNNISIPYQQIVIRQPEKDVKYE